MEQKYINLGELKEFVKNHNLSDMYSVIQFKALVTILTVQNKLINLEMNVNITFDGYENYGTVSLFESNIDPYLYPTVFYAQWQKMEYVNNEYLRITDTHTKNPSIGKYEVKIIPLSRLRE